MKVNRARFSITSLIYVLITCLMVTVVLGCQKEVKPTGTITLYTSVPTAIIEELRQDFEAKNPGMYLEIYRKGTSAIVEKINEEITQNRGVLYDPQVADACLKLFTEKGFKFG